MANPREPLPLILPRQILRTPGLIKLPASIVAVSSVATALGNASLFAIAPVVCPGPADLADTDMKIRSQRI
ncbi:MAG: hypothetical protein KTR19_12170 [Hyphomicrobiales bacterium]|nr:hypothetical protein [Hyphomicrobiales bacterium]